MSLPEVLLGQRIRRKQLDGLHIRRQHPIGPYVLDFYCDEKKLCIEVDGYSHSVGNQPERDDIRDNWLASRGVRTLRLSARTVLAHMEVALDTIRREALD
jgi:very-short-patch-repair endonuclease